MVGSSGLVAWLVLSAAPIGQYFGETGGSDRSDGPLLLPGTGPAAGFATAGTEEEFIPAPTRTPEPKPAESMFPTIEASFADPVGREIARSMFEDDEPSPPEKNPFIEERPEELPPHLRPVPRPPTEDGPPAPPPIRPRDEAYEDGLEPFPAPMPPEPDRRGAGIAPPDELPPEPGQPTGECDSCGELDDTCAEASCGMACTDAGGGLIDWLWGIQFQGWLNQGVTLNTDSPNNGSNFPVGFNDQSNEYQLNQLYVVLERPVNRSGCCWDFGGRVDLLYGTDHFFTTARGLETHGDFSPKWNSGLYGLAMPQAYAEVYAPVFTGINLKFGHFYSPLGYEVVPAPGNFFYSHTYARLYGEPFTHTGILGSTQLGGFTVRSGLTRGWDNWEDNNNDLALLSGVSWTSPDCQTSLAFNAHIGREQDEPDNTDVRRSFSLVLQQQINPWWNYVVQYDHGFEALGAGTRDSEWYGLTQYLFYTINCRWKWGFRSEWFRDDGGALVHPARIGRSNFFAITTGLNYTPNERVVVRPSFRWDWTTTPGSRTYINFSRHDQITLDMDVIVRF
jgi:hypothetical protein